jgi:mannose-6-phosphate isomerase-like protein (cupin superfamily)
MTRPAGRGKRRLAAPEAYLRGIYEETRPWGKFRRYPHEPAASIKVITVNPGSALSLQLHSRRAEFWVVLDPGLEVTVGERTWAASPGEEVVIPAGAPHRLRNFHDKPARVMEIWLGRSSESDITRLKDDYGRN